MGGEVVFMPYLFVLYEELPIKYASRAAGRCCCGGAVGAWKI
jgi:hypothetical protein